jgi:hypothetical protein
MNLRNSSVSSSVLSDIDLNRKREMKLIIESVDNGYIIIREIGGEIEEKVVFAFNEFEKECAVELLCCIKEMLGFYGSKHDSERIFIRLEKQNDS